MRMNLPELCLVLLVGPSGAGKSTLARRLFKASEVVSSDACREMLADDPNDQLITPAAFALLNHITEERLKGGRLTVIDATNVQPEARRPLLEIARRQHVFVAAIVLAVDPQVCIDRDAARPDRTVGPRAIHAQTANLRRSLRELEREGVRYVTVLRSPEEADTLEIERERLWVNRRDERGPFDIIGDVHGCADELEALLEGLGYAEGEGGLRRHPAGRRAVFLGDLVDRGPAVPAVLRRVMGMVAAGEALCVSGNHDVKLVKALSGREVKVNHGLKESLDQLAQETPAFRDEVRQFLGGLVSHYMLDGGDLAVAHAGIKAQHQGRTSGRVRDFCLYGDTTGEIDEYGLPVRQDWSVNYRGKALVVYGHTPMPEPAYLNNTVCVDTGCVFGGKLTALRYPERELRSVQAAREYYAPSRPLQAGARAPAPLRAAAALDLEPLVGRQHIITRMGPVVAVPEDEAAAALEVMSRFSADPRWLIYLPPTMSPCATSRKEGWLERPEEAFSYYRDQGVDEVVCEEKHMGSRAVVVVCRDEAAARRRFGVEAGSGRILSRTGRPFFNDGALEAALLEEVRAAAEAAGLWTELRTDWLCLDCELMPWSAKAQDLLRQQYAPVGTSAALALGAAVEALSQAAGAGREVGALLEQTRARLQAVEGYRAAWRRYCWPVSSVFDLRLAPFHLLASEGAVHDRKDHAWHMEMASRLCDARPGPLFPTRWRAVQLADEAAVASAIAWWEEMTAAGGEGMVVKPKAFLHRGPKGFVQPAVKCRGREYLRIIYGPEYTLPNQLPRLKSRGLGGKRRLAMQEFLLGLEGLHRFVEGEPLARVHAAAFGVLALESEPVDPRL